LDRLLRFFVFIVEAQGELNLQDFLETGVLADDGLVADDAEQAV
jgi:hypothetical protein